LDDLSLILDPDGQDVHIDITTYQTGINEWIEDIRKRRYIVQSYVSNVCMMTLGLLVMDVELEDLIF